MSGKGGQKSETSKQAPTQKTKAAVDRRQNHRMLPQCLSGIAQRHAIAFPTAMQNRVTMTVCSSAVGKRLKQKKSNSLSIAQHHLPALALFWASFFLRVQLTSLLLISPGRTLLYIKRFKRVLFMRSKHNMQILGVIPFIKLQSDT